VVLTPRPEVAPFQAGYLDRHGIPKLLVSAVLSQMVWGINSPLRALYSLAKVCGCQAFMAILVATEQIASSKARESDARGIK
jgi:hypothetical protein